MLHLLFVMHNSQGFSSLVRTSHAAAAVLGFLHLEQANCNGKLRIAAGGRPGTCNSGPPQQRAVLRR